MMAAETPSGQLGETPGGSVGKFSEEQSGISDSKLPSAESSAGVVDDILRDFKCHLQCSDSEDDEFQDAQSDFNELEAGCDSPFDPSHSADDVTSSNRSCDQLSQGKQTSVEVSDTSVAFEGDTLRYRSDGSLGQDDHCDEQVMAHGISSETNTCCTGNSAKKNASFTDVVTSKGEGNSASEIDASSGGVTAGPQNRDNLPENNAVLEEALGGATEEESRSEQGAEPEEIVHDEEEMVRQLEATWSEEEKEDKKAEAQQLKNAGNQLFKQGCYEEAKEQYTQALALCPTCFPKERSIMYSNRAACRMRAEENDDAIKDCTNALNLNPGYLKCLLRRAELHEKTEKLEEALADYQKVVEMDPSIHSARRACLRLPEQIKERNEKLKEEMMGKLKDLGNMILKPFGLSTDNFQLSQDPNSGGYSVNFKR